MAKNTRKVREKSGNFVTPEKWEPCQWSDAIKTLCNYIPDHLELLLEHILNTDPNEMWQEKYDQRVELFSRMCKALEHFVSLKHPQTCIKYKSDYN